MTERFDLEKWLRDRGFTTATEFRFTHWPFHFEDLKGLIEAAENHQRELMECGHPRACGHFHIDLRGFPSDRVCHCDMPEAQRKICTVCAELSRVHQEARAEALKQAAAFVEKNTPYLPGVGSVGYPMAQHIREKLIPAEAQGASQWKEAINTIAIMLGPERCTEEHPPIQDPQTVVRAVKRLIESHVSERTKRLREAATTKPPEPRYIPAADGKEMTWLRGWRAGVEAMIAKVRALESE